MLLCFQQGEYRSVQFVASTTKSTDETPLIMVGKIYDKYQRVSALGCWSQSISDRYVLYVAFECSGGADSILRLREACTKFSGLVIIHPPDASAFKLMLTSI